MTAHPLPSRAFVDSGAFYALSDSADQNHQGARLIQTQLAAARVRLFTSNFIIDEAYTLHLMRLNHHAAIVFLDQVAASTLTVLRIEPEDEQHAKRILRTYIDKRFSYTDATSFAVMERVDIAHAFAFDRNFTQYGFTVLHIS